MVVLLGKLGLLYCTNDVKEETGMYVDVKLEHSSTKLIIDRWRFKIYPF